MAAQIIVTAVAIALAYTASYLYAKSNKPKTLRDTKPTTLSERGSYIPLVIGTRRVGPVVAWAGNRRTQTSSSGKTTYYERAMHLLCVGPARKLHKIYLNGKNILPAPLDSTTTPSGSLITLPHSRGSFVIYWGESDQPINTYLGDAGRVGVSSRWPYMCYIEWRNKVLGTSAIWPVLEYEIEVCAGYTPLSQSSQWLDNGTSTGINPAHALFQLLTAPYPHGVGLSHSYVDSISLEAFGVLCETEHLPMNLFAQDGTAAIKKIAEIMQDAGVFIPQAAHFLKFLSIRPVTEAVPELDESVCQLDQIEIKSALGPQEASRIIYMYLDRSLNYDQADIVNDNDGVCVGSPRTRQVDLSSVTDREVAVKIADRRAAEDHANMSRLKITCTRGIRAVCPGQVVSLPDIGQLRIVSKKLDPLSSRVELECVQDLYGIDPSSLTPPVPPEPQGGSEDAEKDTAFTFRETTEPSDSGPSIEVFRIRAHGQVTGSMIYGSMNGSSYQLIGYQDNYASGGPLTTALVQGNYSLVSITVLTKTLQVTGDASDLQAGDKITITGTSDGTQDDTELTVVSATFDGPNTSVIVSEAIPGSDSTGGTFICTMIENGPVFEASNDDIADVLDLSGDVSLWQAGKQQCMIEDELIYLRNITALGGDTYRLDGLLRAQQGTTQAAHASGKYAFIMDADLLTSLSSSVLTAGTLIVKSVPFNEDSVVDIASVTGVTKTLVGP